jgi:hypothetical protein
MLQAHHSYNRLHHRGRLADVHNTVSDNVPLQNAHPDLHLCMDLHLLQAHHSYNHTDVYNTCLFRLLIRNNNTGPPDAVLYDFPLGWWDHDWANCFQSRNEINDTHWRKVAGSFLAMHNR